MLSHASIKGREMLFKALLNEDECMHLNMHLSYWWTAFLSVNF